MAQRMSRRYEPRKDMTPEQNRMRALGYLVRSGKATPEEEAEAGRLQGQLRAQAAVPSARTIFDLDVARWAWRSDARSVERG